MNMPVTSRSNLFKFYVHLLFCGFVGSSRQSLKLGRSYRERNVGDLLVRLHFGFGGGE